METREQLGQYADNLLLQARRYASANHALIFFPGDEGGYGRRVDGLEGFARTFLLAGFRLAGQEGDDPHGFAEWYAQGLAAGTDPESPERWIRVTEHDQAKVEAASIALILDMTRPWIWDRLDEQVRQNVIDYFAPVVGDQTYPRNNWIWFRIVVQTFLRSVGGPYSLEDINADLDTHHSYVREGGWYSDGPERAYDHYVGWAMHLYPALWARMQGASELANPERMALYNRMLAAYLKNTVHLVGGNGSPLIQGRSLIYRYAAAAPYWVGALAGVDLPMGLLRNCAMSVIDHFIKSGTGEVLTMGWHREWRKMAQSYSGPGSPYWAVKGLLGLALPADHPVWTAAAVELPSTTEDALFAIESPGWIVSTTKSDGIARVINHGTDRALEKTPSADSPLYGRFGYSTATAPLLGDAAWRDPVDESVVLLDADGRATHRGGMHLLGARVDDGVGIAASRGQLHWLAGEQTQIGHGSGLHGDTEKAADSYAVSLVRGPWVLRLVRVDNVSEKAQAMRSGGWPLSSDKQATVTASNSWARADAAVNASARTLTSFVAAIDETAAIAGVTQAKDDSMLALNSSVPWVQVPVRPGEWVAFFESLSGDGAAEGFDATCEQVADVLTVRATWPDGTTTDHKVEVG